MNATQVWEEIQENAKATVNRESALKELLTEVILKRDSLEEALSVRLSRKLAYHSTPESYLNEVFCDAFKQDHSIAEKVRQDILAICERDPACPNLLTPVLYFKGFHAITCHRIGHWLWQVGRKDLAFYLQSLVSEVFSVDIHPAAQIGGGILLDHAHGFVAGETSVIADNVSILHGVTLGGTGKVSGDRHPKVGSGVLIGAGAKLLGNITIGECAKIGAGSVVLTDIPAHTTAVGVPAVVVGKAKDNEPCRGMDHSI